ncbi:AraC family transcriptional regulator [Enterococcus sp. LJL90]
MKPYLEIVNYSERGNYFLHIYDNDGIEVFLPHWHRDIEIVYCEVGTAKILYENGMLTLSEGEIHFFASGEPHAFLTSPGSKRLVIQVDLQFFNETILNINNEKDLYALFSEGKRSSNEWPEELTNELRKAMKRMYLLSESQAVGKHYGIFACMYDIIFSFYSLLPEKEATEEGSGQQFSQHVEAIERLGIIFQYIKDHFHDNLQLNDIARIVNLTPSYFSRFFKNSTGYTFKDFLTSYRINQAQFLLINDNQSMDIVAEQAGFSSTKTFHHVFKEKVGISPLKYRKINSGNF